MRFTNTLVFLAALVACGGQQQQVIQNKGSDTLVNVAQVWAESYRAVNPTVAVAVSGGGSGTGISALINGTVDLANSSRRMTDSEIEEARRRGVEPVEYVVGLDALAVFLHPSNPLTELTFEQLRQIYGENGSIVNWRDFNIQIPGCDNGEIVVVSRQNNSGTYAYFKEAVLGEEIEYRLGTLDMHGSKDVADLVAKTPCAIGYSGLAYVTEEVRVPCLKTTNESAGVAPSAQTALDKSYPISRPLMMYTNGQPSGAIASYLDWILSQEGQCLLVHNGYASAADVVCE